MAKQIQTQAVAGNGTPKLTFREKFSFGIGDTIGTFGTSVIALFYLKYLTDILSLGAMLAGYVMLITQLYTAFSDPFIGQLSDSTHTRWGRRRFYILFFTIPAGITYYLLWAIPLGWNQDLRFIAAIVASMIYFTFFTLVTVPYATLTVEMTDDYDERSSLTSYRMFVSIIGGLVAIALPYILVPDMLADKSNFKDVYNGYLLTGVIIAIIIGTIPFITFFGCKERSSYKPIPGGVKMLVATYKTMIKNAPFRNATLSYMFTWGGFSVMQAFFMFYLESYLGIRDMWTMLGIVSLLFIAAAGFLPLWLYLMRKIGKKLSYNIGMGALALCSMLIMLIPPGHVVWVFILVFFMSFGVSAAHVVPMSIIPDTIDVSRLKSGYDTEGLYYGFQSFVQKAATAGFVGLAGVALGWAGYIKLEDLLPNQMQPASAILAIRLTFSAIPAVFMGIGVIFMHFMKLDRRSHQETIQTINARKEGSDD
jgi:sugar (glycoside-pentoside-hexuronide) transporter